MASTSTPSASATPPSPRPAATSTTPSPPRRTASLTRRAPTTATSRTFTPTNRAGSAPNCSPPASASPPGARASGCSIPTVPRWWSTPARTTTAASRSAPRAAVWPAGGSPRAEPGSLVPELEAGQPRIETAGGDQGGVGPLLSHPTVLHHHDPVGAQDGRQPVGDHQGG